MNDIETMLLKQSLRQPTTKLDNRVLHTVRRTVAWNRPWRLNLFVGALGASMAASLAFAVVLNLPSEAPAATPFSITQNWTSYQPDAVSYPADAPPVMTVRCRQLRTEQFVDPANNVHMQWTVPTEQTMQMSLPVD